MSRAEPHPDGANGKQAIIVKVPCRSIKVINDRLHREGMSLEEYRKKRNFSKTKEPKGGIRRDATGKIYVIQKHDAGTLHYDLRLESEGVLKSWAVPKTPPQERGTKRLAIQTEDHPIEYAEFQGTIPEGEYGAGTVEIWDKGTYTLKNRTDKMIEVTLQGTKLNGNYALINFKEKNWLFIKKRT